MELFKNLKRLWFKYLSLILIVVNTSILFAQFEKNALVLKRELILNSHVIGQEKQDVLKLTNGSTYNGEFIKIESGNVLFKPEGAIGPLRIKINEIKMLKLSNGTEIIDWGKMYRNRWS